MERQRLLCLCVLFGGVVLARRVERSVTAMCSVALRIDCANDYVQQSDETLCATNGVDYANLCFFSKDKCSLPALNIRHFGLCTTTATPPLPPATTLTTTTTTSEPARAATSTTKTPTTATATTTAADEYEILRRVFCAPEAQVDCRLFAAAPYCGSDGVVYTNECEFVRAQCSLDITAQDMTYCIAATTNHLHRSGRHHLNHRG